MTRRDFLAALVAVPAVAAAGASGPPAVWVRGHFTHTAFGVGFYVTETLLDDEIEIVTRLARAAANHQQQMIASVFSDLPR